MYQKSKKATFERVLDCFFNNSVKEKELYDVNFLLKQYKNHSGKLVYGLDRSGYCTNTLADSYLWTGNVISIMHEQIEIKNKNCCNINLFEFIKNCNYDNDKQIFNKLDDFIKNFINESKLKNEDWALSININDSLNILGYNNKIQNLLNIFLDNYEKYIATEKRTLFNIKYNTQNKVINSINKNIFLNYIIDYSDINSFHSFNNFEWYLNNNFIISIFEPCKINYEIRNEKYIQDFYNLKILKYSISKCFFKKEIITNRCSNLKIDNNIMTSFSGINIAYFSQKFNPIEYLISLFPKLGLCQKKEII